MEQYIEHPMIENEACHEDISKLKSTSGGASGLESNPSGGFECNICLDSVQDPVVTFCGHLYCWACIYRWIQSQSQSQGGYSLEEHPEPQCPVCKANVSLNTLIPLYGRGRSGKSSDIKGGVVPQRPNHQPTCGVHTLITATASTSSHSNQHHGIHRAHPHQQVHPYYSLGDYPPSPAFGFAGTTTFHPMIGMFGEMIYGRIFGNSHATLYAYPNTYNVGTTSSGRPRRHVMQVDRSLSRLSFFLCCCVILCLLLF